MTESSARDGWERRSQLLDRLLDLPAARRSEELNALWREAPELAEELAGYLRLEARLVGFLDRPLLSRVTETRVRMTAGARIGSFEIVECLGYGGMGEVYLARRVDAFDQRVAVKVIRRGKHTANWVARFKRERQLLARLTHPNIAGLLDGGHTEDGLPYLVMEYVEGEAVDDFIRGMGFTIPKILGLFLKICGAVAYLHKNLVVHRDLKPSNVLVTASGEPKLVDFGIAKFLGNEVIEPSLTEGLLPPKTLLFASPEQIEELPITTASDVYSMGVLLSVLLTGETPYGSPRGEYWLKRELERAICEEPARPPSQVSPPRGESRFRRFSRDLDSIVLKCLTKEPQARYDSVEALAEDVRRYLEGRSVRAHQGDALYRAGKFVRTYRVAVGFVAVIMASAIFSSTQGLRAVRERDSAILARSRAETYATFLEDLFEETAPDQSKGGGLSVVELLGRGRRKLLEKPSNGIQPDRELADLTSSLGEIYRKRGGYEEAAELLEVAIERWRGILAGEDASSQDALRLAKVLNQRCAVAFERGQLEHAETLILESLAIRQEHGISALDLDPARLNLATIRFQRGLYGQAEEAYLESLEIRLQSFGENSVEVAESYYLLGALEYDRGNLKAAEEYLDRSLRLRAKLLGPLSIKTATVRSSLGRVLLARGRLRAAEREFREALTVRKDLLPDGHEAIALSKRDLASVLLELGHPATAFVYASDALASLKTSVPDSEFEIATGESVLGACLLALDRFDEARILIDRSHETILRLRGPRSTYSRQAAYRLEQLKSRSEPSKQAKERGRLTVRETASPH